MLLQIEQWYAAIDYIRMTWKVSSMNDERFGLVWPKVRGIASQVENGVGQGEFTRMLGYTGMRAGKVFLGSSDQGAMLQASGIAAQMVCELGLHPDNVSRMDLQSTVWFNVYYPGLAKEAADEVVNAYRFRRGRKPAIRHIVGFGGGDTLYIGTRGKRGVMIRVYDKEKESKEAVFDNSWRYEAELTDVYATEAYWACADGKWGEPVIARLLMGYLKMRGLELSLKGEAAGFDLKSIPKDKSSTERRLAWLASQVRPAIQRLELDGVDLGEILSALGITDL